jgi:hypothetical protein
MKKSVPPEPGSVWVKFRGLHHHSISVGSKALVVATFSYYRNLVALRDRKSSTMVKLNLFGQIRNLDLRNFLRTFKRAD